MCVHKLGLAAATDPGLSCLRRPQWGTRAALLLGCISEDMYCTVQGIRRTVATHSQQPACIGAALVRGLLTWH